VEQWFRLVGPERTVEIGGVKLVGVNAETGGKLLATLVLIVVVVLLSRLLQAVAGWFPRRRHDERVRFWVRQAIRMITAAVLLIGVVSIWFDDPSRLATALGLVTAGLAFALQKVVTAVAGYFVILRGKTFHVGDRIVMGGVRGDVIALGFIQTTIMEMGQPPPVQNDDPAMWVRSRQYTGRIVTISNSKIFDEPVYNYSREFPYIWEEMTLPITYAADRARAEQILLEAAARHTVPIGKIGADALAHMQRLYFLRPAEVAPCVYYRLTDNWLELTVRFIARDHGVRELKDALSRDIMRALDEAGIGVASATFDIVGMPPLRVAVRREAKEPPR
jgi:small-conductance mechanosensitive channel